MTRTLILVKHAMSASEPAVPSREWHLSDAGRAPCLPLAEQHEGRVPQRAFLPLPGISSRIGAHGGVVGIELRPVSPLIFLLDETLGIRVHHDPPSTTVYTV